MLSNAKLSKESTDFMKVRDLTSQNPDISVKTQKGKLLQDGTEIDKFDISHQFFC